MPIGIVLVIYVGMIDQFNLLQNRFIKVIHDNHLLSMIYFRR